MHNPVTSLLATSDRTRFIILLLLLIGTLTPISWILYKTLDRQEQVDSISYRSYAVERSLNALSAHIQDAIRKPKESTPEVLNETLIESYDVFYANTEVFDSIPRLDLLTHSTEYDQIIKKLQVFLSEYEKVFLPGVDIVSQPALLKKIQAEVEALKPATERLTWVANRASERFVDERNQLLARQGKAVVALCGLLVLGLLIFVYFLNRQVLEQRQQYQTLERLNSDLQVLKIQAESASEAKSLFLANMSHELRTPFQGLLGMLSLLKDSPLSPQQREQLSTSENCASHLLGLLSDLVDVSLLETGGVKLRATKFNLHILIQDLVHILEPTTKQKGLDINVLLPSGAPTWVEGDAVRVRQIVINLLNNAIKFTHQGAVTIKLLPSSDKTEVVQLQVSDTGEGMDAETQKHMFERFYQADTTLRRRHGGSGLGLEIAQNLARLMGGAISVSSQLGVGSTFSVSLRLPATEPPVLLVESSKSPIALPPAASRALTSILVAEDNAINRKYLESVLHRMGHQVQFCENGQACIDLLLARQRNAKESPYDLILMDYHMPVLDGIAATKVIRGFQASFSDIKIVLITADLSVQVRGLAQSVGVDAVLDKPVLQEALQNTFVKLGFA